MFLELLLTATFLEGLHGNIIDFPTISQLSLDHSSHQDGPVPLELELDGLSW
jgi:hypothetical protein